MGGGFAEAPNLGCDGFAPFLFDRMGRPPVPCAIPFFFTGCCFRLTANFFGFGAFAALTGLAESFEIGVDT